MVDSLLHGHRKFVRNKAGNAGTFLQKLASEVQSPSALYVGCSDSRVVPELLTSSAPGELFVVRNVANLVPTFENADSSVGAAIEYAVGHLRVPHVVVCGHYGCGGIHAAVDGLHHVAGMPSLFEWLSTVTPAVERARVDAKDAEHLWRRSVEESVLTQLDNLSTYPLVAKALAEATIELHGWVYDLYSLQLYVYDPESDAFVPAHEVLT